MGMDEVRQIYHEVYNVWFGKWKRRDLSDDQTFAHMLSEGAELILRHGSCDMARHMVHDLIDVMEAGL